MSTNSGHHEKNIQIDEPLCFVFPAFLFGTAQTTKEKCERDIGEEQGKQILI